MIRKHIYIRLTAVLLVISGVIILFTRLNIYDLIISSLFVLSPNSLIYEAWRKPPVAVTTKFYFFNWTNPEEIFNQSSKPRFEQVGPYTFRTETEKVNITWNQNNTVTFRIFQSYFFDPESSNGSLNDLVTTLNTVTVSASHKIRYESYFTKRGFSLSLGVFAPDIHVVKPVHQLLFDGYEDTYVDIPQMFPFLADSEAPNIDKAGFLYGRNNSYTIDGTYNVATGVNENTGEILAWNYNKEVAQHDGFCAKLGGSVGEFYPQRRTKDFINMFIGDTCRNFKLDFEKETVVKGIPGYKYSARHSVLDNGTVVPENKCFCRGECVPSGVMNASSCSYGAPTFLSLPHFYGADDSYYLDQVEGLKPDKSKHEMFVTLEPRVGFCIDIALRLQLNFLLQPVEHITLFENVPKVFFPILWSEQRVSVPDDFATMTRILLSIPDIILPVIAATLLIIGLLLITCTMYKPKRKKAAIMMDENLKNKEKLLKNKDKIIVGNNKKDDKSYLC